MLNKIRYIAGIMLGIAVLVTGCDSSEVALKQAAQARWDALVKGNLDAAYTYYTDAFKQTTSLDIFKNQTRGVDLWSGADVKTVQCESSGKRCLVDVDVSVAMRMRGLVEPVVTTDVVKETWVKEGWFSDWRYIKD